MFPNSSLAVDICLEPTTKYVSSTYFIILLCSCMGPRFWNRSITAAVVHPVWPERPRNRKAWLIKIACHLLEEWYHDNSSTDISSTTLRLQTFRIPTFR